MGNASKLKLHHQLRLIFWETSPQWSASDWSDRINFSETSYGILKNVAGREGFFTMKPKEPKIFMDALIDRDIVYGGTFKAHQLGTNVVNKFLAHLGLEYVAAG